MNSVPTKYLVKLNNLKAVLLLISTRLLLNYSKLQFAHTKFLTIYRFNLLL